MSDTAKNFDVLATDLSILHNYFGSTKLFFYLYPVFSKTVLSVFK